MKKTVLRVIRVVPVCAALALGIVLAGAGEPPDSDVWLEKGAAALKDFKHELKAALIEGMKESPEKAIEVCRVLAPKIAAEAGSDTVRVGRAAHRVRNPENAPKPWMEPLLDGYLKSEGKAGPQVVALSGGGVGYVEPIYTSGLCLKCHGVDLDPSVEAKLAGLYPEDKARGFTEGEFRGLFWVEFSGTE